MINQKKKKTENVEFSNKKKTMLFILNEESDLQKKSNHLYIRYVNAIKK